MYRLLIALDAHMFSHNGYGSRTQALDPPDPGQQPLGPWSRAHIHYG